MMFFRLKTSCSRAFSSEVDTGSRKENAKKQNLKAVDPIKQKRKPLSSMLRKSVSGFAITTCDNTKT
jgi:hypothetical protein